MAGSSDHANGLSGSIESTNFEDCVRYELVVGVTYLSSGDGLDGPGSIPGMIRFFSSPQRPDWLWGPPSLLSNGYRERLPRG
jgi:hypothetical protein